jgi:hypothetical protein
LTFTSPGTNMQRFRERVDNLTFVERKAPARTSNPFTDPESMIDASELLKRIATGCTQEKSQRQGPRCHHLNCLSFHPVLSWNPCDADFVMPK